jgi:hypothetical protein
VVRWFPSGSSQAVPPTPKPTILVLLAIVVETMIMVMVMVMVMVIIIQTGMVMVFCLRHPNGNHPWRNLRLLLIQAQQLL